MPAGTVRWYSQAVARLLNKEIDWLDETMKMSLHTPTYVPDTDSHDYYNDVTGEVSGSGYSTGGQTLSGKTQAFTTGPRRWTLGCASVVWGTVTITNAKYAVIYKSTGVSSTSPLICLIEFDRSYSVSGQNFTVSINAAGLLVATFT